MPPTRAPLGARLFSTAGVVALAGIVVVSGGAMLMWLELTPAPVEVFEVTAHFAWNVSSGASTTLRADAPRLAHCVGAYLNPNPRQLWVYGAPIDRTVTSVVLVAYPDPSSFSGGGDDTAVFFLKRGERAVVKAALNTSTALYRIEPGGSPTVVVVTAKEAGPGRLDAEYLISGTVGAELGGPRVGSFIVDEHHTVEDLGALPVVNRGVQPCA